MSQCKHVPNVIVEDWERKRIFVEGVLMIQSPELEKFSTIVLIKSSIFAITSCALSGAEEEDTEDIAGAGE
jgi:hypothetical protein